MLRSERYDENPNTLCYETKLLLAFAGMHLPHELLSITQHTNFIWWAETPSWSKKPTTIRSITSRPTKEDRYPKCTIHSLLRSIWLGFRCGQNRADLWFSVDASDSHCYSVHTHLYCHCLSNKRFIALSQLQGSSLEMLQCHALTTVIRCRTIDGKWTSGLQHFSFYNYPSYIMMHYTSPIILWEKTSRLVRAKKEGNGEGSDYVVSYVARSDWTILNRKRKRIINLNQPISD